MVSNIPIKIFSFELSSTKHHQNANQKMSPSAEMECGEIKGLSETLTLERPIPQSELQNPQSPLPPFASHFPFSKSFKRKSNMVSDQGRWKKSGKLK